MQRPEAGVCLEFSQNSKGTIVARVTDLARGGGVEGGISR